MKFFLIFFAEDFESSESSTSSFCDTGKEFRELDWIFLSIKITVRAWKKFPRCYIWWTIFQIFRDQKVLFRCFQKIPWWPYYRQFFHIGVSRQNQCMIIKKMYWPRNLWRRLQSAYKLLNLRCNPISDFFSKYNLCAHFWPLFICIEMKIIHQFSKSSYW